MMDLPQSILQGIKCPHHMGDPLFDIFAEESRLAEGVDAIFAECMGQLWIDFHVGDMDSEFKKSKKEK
jgi:hypothetical protein